MGSKVPHFCYDDGFRGDDSVRGAGSSKMVKKSEEIDGEVIDLEPFERAVEKLRTHNAHCTNCKSRITKFLLQRPDSNNSTSVIQKNRIVSAPTFGKLTKQTSNKTLQHGDKHLSIKLLKQASMKSVKPGKLTSLGFEPARMVESVYVPELRGSRIGEIMSSIVYGGLMVSFTSLALISSTAASGTDTARTVTIGVANVLLGLFVIFINLMELKNRYYNFDRYREILGSRRNFLMHATIAVLSYLAFGLVPPLVYGFTFGERDSKLLTVAVASFACISLLAVVKAYTKRAYRFSSYFIKIVLYNVIGGILAIGVGYAAGYLVKKLIDELGWFDSDLTPTLLFPPERFIK